MPTPLDPPATYHKYLISLGNTTGIITVSFDNNPPSSSNPQAIPAAFRLKWNSLNFPSGNPQFYGDGSYNSDLISKGFTAVVGGQTGTVSFNKTSALPDYAELEVFTPLNNTITDFVIICPTPLPSPTPPGFTPPPTPTPAGCVFGESCPPPNTGQCPADCEATGFGISGCVEKFKITCSEDSDGECNCTYTSEWVKCSECPPAPSNPDPCPASIEYCSGAGMPCCNDKCEKDGPNSDNVMCPEGEICCPGQGCEPKMCPSCCTDLIPGGTGEYAKIPCQECTSWYCNPGSERRCREGPYEIGYATESECESYCQ